ncbi:acetylcholinesterase-1-like isoform X2 [Haemaphysalis longicornis]
MHHFGILVFVALWSTFVNAQDTNTVSTSLGAVIGKQVCVQQHCVQAFLGIPFAEPPVGALRFARPVPKKPWQGPLRAMEFSKPCFQRRGNIPQVPWQGDETESSEDCLYLNVWTPQNRCSGAPTAVILWLHGGSYRIGSTDLDLYDGSALAGYGQVVVVSANYRLGALGFLNANVTDIPGNMGLWDQYLALRWVHDNIAKFGGDASMITVFGESAGGASAGMLAQSPLCRGLVRRIIMQSGNPRWPLPMENDDGPGSVRRALAIALGVGCLHSEAAETLTADVIACLRNVSAEDIARAELQSFGDHLFTFMPSFGDALVPMRPIAAVEQGKILPVDVMLGTNIREGAILHYMRSGSDGIPKNWTSSGAGIDVEFGRQYLALVFAAFPKPIIDRIIERYLGHMTEHSSPRDVFAAMVSAGGDFLFNCPVVFFAESFSRRLGVLLAYKFPHVALHSYWPEEYEATHSDEIQFVFGAPLRHPDLYSMEDLLMSETMMAAWAAFAHTGRPVLPNGAAWPNYDDGGRSYVTFDHGMAEVSRSLEGQNCAFWKGLI